MTNTTLETKMFNSATQLRETLLQSVNTEKKQFLALAQQFYENETRDQKESIKLTKEIIAVVDRILSAGDWEESLFLRNTAKPLKKIREDALLLQQQLLGEETVDMSEVDIAEDQVKLFISLFQNEGHNLKKWALQLKSLASYMIGRPIYENELDVQKAIRVKQIKVSEAYAVVVVNHSAIIASAHQAKRVDRQGSALVNLTAGAVTYDNIIEFVHQEQRYRFVDGQLIKKK